MQLEYKVTFETPTNDFNKNHYYSSFIMEKIQDLLMDFVFNGEVERLTDLRRPSPHTLETYYDLENEADLRQ